MRARALRSRLATSWPTLLVASACAGIACGGALRPSPGWLLGLLAVAVLAAVVLDGSLRLIAVGGALVLAGAWWGGLRAEALASSPLSGRLGETARARAVVTGPARRTRFAVRMPAEMRRFDGRPLRERVLLELPPERAPPQGAVLELLARPVAPRGPETGFDERAWLARRGIHVVVLGRSARIVGRRGGIGGVADRLREHVARALSAGTDGERRSLLLGIVLGAEEGVDDELRDDFRASGLAHLLAVSGQNVMFVAAGTVAALYVLGLSSLVGHGAAIVSVLAYVLAVGWQPSVIRAGVAGVLASLAWLAARPKDGWHFMALGALVLLAWQPSSLLDPGFQLSFAAVAAIFLWFQRLTRVADGYPVPKKVAQAGALALACGVATAPIVWLHFGAVPVWSIPANVLAEPAMPPLLLLGLAAAAVEPVLPTAALAMAWLAGWCAAWIALCARLFASLPFAQVESSGALAVGAGAIAAIVVLARLPRSRRRTAVALAVPAAFVIAVGWWALRPGSDWRPPTGLRVTFLDVGQGDSILLEVPQGGVLVDQGPPEADVAAQLRRTGLRALSAVVLTHPQRDHVGGAADVLRRLHVESVLDPGLAVSGPEERAALSVAGDRHVPVTLARAGSRYRLGRLQLRVLWPDGPGPAGADPNDHAIVLLATYGAVDLLLTADAESNVTARLPLRPVEVLKVAHHGSEDAGLDEELRVLRPRIAVISVGRGNDYGHPRPETLSALGGVSSLRLYRTDRDGRVVLESDGRVLAVHTEGHG